MKRSRTEYLAWAALGVAAAATAVGFYWLGTVRGDSGEIASPSTTASPRPSASVPANEIEQATVEAQPTSLGLELVSDDVTWFPISSSEGPSTFTDVESSGFGRTPEGAALAATHIYIRTLPYTTDAWQRAIDHQVVGVFQSDYQRNVELAVTTLGQEQAIAGARSVAPIGWTINGFNDLESDLTIYWRTSATDPPSVLAQSVRVVWQEEDWHLVAPPNGTFQDMFAYSTATPEFDFSEAYE